MNTSKKIKILVLDDQAIERKKAIASLIPVELAFDNQKRIDMAYQMYDIREINIVGIAIYEILRAGYRPDLVIGDINFSYISESDIKNADAKYNLNWEVESGANRGLAFLPEIKNYIREMPEYIIWSYKTFQNETTTNLFENRKYDILPKIEVGDNVNRLYTRLFLKLQKVIQNKLNEDLSFKNKLKCWVRDKNDELLDEPLKNFVNELLAPFYTYYFDNADGKIKTILNEKPINLIAKCLIENEEIDWENFKFRGIMALLNSYDLLKLYHEATKTNVSLKGDIDNEAEQFVDSFLKNQTIRLSGDYNSFTITDALLINHIDDFDFYITNPIWYKMRNLFICQRIVCLVSVLEEKNYPNLSDSIYRVMILLRNSRGGGPIDNNDFINSIGLSRKNNGRAVRTQLGYVMPDIADFVSRTLSEKLPKNSQV